MAKKVKKRVFITCLDDKPVKKDLNYYFTRQVSITSTPLKTRNSQNTKEITLMMHCYKFKWSEYIRKGKYFCPYM